MDCEIKVKVKYGWLHSRGHAKMYTADPIHRGPLLREIQYITNRPWTPNLPWAKKKNKKKTYSMFIVLLNLKQKKNWLICSGLDFLRISRCEVSPRIMTKQSN